MPGRIARTYYVVPAGRDGWKVRVEGSIVGSLPYGTREEAVEQAERLVQRAGGGRVVFLDDERWVQVEPDRRPS